MSFFERYLLTEEQESVLDKDLLRAYKLISSIVAGSLLFHHAYLMYQDCEEFCMKVKKRAEEECKKRSTTSRQKT